MSPVRGAYDFETYNWTKALCIGLRWGTDGWAFFRHPTDNRRVVEFTLRTMLMLAEHGQVKEWWAHNGGNFDALLILQLAKDFGFKVDLATSMGGRVVMMKVTDGKTSFTLKDSFAIVPTSLKAAAESFELQSRKRFTETDYSKDMRDLPLEQLKEGCRVDCDIVLELLDTVESHLEQWGGTLKTTFSSSALSVVRSRVALPCINPTVNAFARRALYGGRVEVFHHDPIHNLREYDVTSSYPWSMTFPLPGETIGLRSPASIDCCGITEARVRVPWTHIPCLPYRDMKGGLYFPIGEWTARFPNNLLRYAREQGVEVDALETYEFEEWCPFKEFVEEVFEVKSKAKGAKREFAKLLLNGMYGKLAEQPEKERLIVFDKEDEALEVLWKAHAYGVKVGVISLDGWSAQMHPVIRWPRQTHFAAAAYITGQSQALLHQHLNAARGPAYCDTDSIHSEPSPNLEKFVNPNLGGLKVEKANMLGKYYAPKIYELFDLDKKEHLVRTKGFRPAVADFKKIVQGEKLFRTSMQKAKTQIKKGNVPKMEDRHRSWSGRSMKRKPLADGSTDAWHVDDLIAGKHLEAMSPLFHRK